jgi:hypothetical protein
MADQEHRPGVATPPADGLARLLVETEPSPRPCACNLTGERAATVTRENERQLDQIPAELNLLAGVRPDEWVRGIATILPPIVATAGVMGRYWLAHGIAKPPTTRDEST